MKTLEPCEREIYIERNQSVKHATYIGKDCGWNVVSGMGALIRSSDKPGFIQAQFDDHYAARNSVDLSRGWHYFPASDFKDD